MAAANGQPDSYFIAEVRRILRDQPVYNQDSMVTDGVRGAFSAASQPFRLQRAPVAKGMTPQLSAPAGANMTGFTAWTPRFDTTPLPPNAPVISDGGAGTMTAATYQVGVTFTVAGVESGLSPLSNALTQIVNKQISVAAITGIPTNVTSVRYYLVTSTAGGRSVGFVVAQTPVAGATGTQLINANGDTLVPMLIVADTGEAIFPVAPATGTFNILYQAARFGDQQVLDALSEGLSLLWPEIHPEPVKDVATISPSPVQVEYNLPASFADPRVVLTEVEVAPVGPYIHYRRVGLWRQAGDTTAPTLIFGRPPPAASTVRLSYITPYASLAATSDQVKHLPVYYAVARLALDQETMRSRAGDAPALTGETVSPVGTAQQIAAFWLDQFAQQLHKLGMDLPTRRTVAGRAVERLGLSGFWQAA